MRTGKVLLLGLGLLATATAGAIGWPAAYEGVMLQGFYWDSYQTETKWTQLTAKADELAPYFKLIWVPNSAKSTGGQGYMPIYWFTNHNSDMGTETELKTMISTYKYKGVGFIADVVINHRNGVSNWVDFPAETWNGVTYQIGTDGICSTDEVWSQGGDYYANMARGAADEGDDFDGSRDLDHTNANVQTNCKAYCKCLLDTWGYVGFRLDMVKGYAGYYTKMYNTYANPTYSVGEYWDSSYDAVATWIENTGGESAAFDFPFKYAVNSAFHSGDLSKLVWYENGTTPKPAGMIHHWYQQLAVTFIDNHDTYRTDGDKFNGNWAAANAFMICSPGTPCVFWPHWTACGDQIARMISARNSVGITNTSEVKVLRTTSTCYMAEVYGAKGTLAVKIGSEMVTPDGYSDSDQYCYGTDYCIWTKSSASDNYPSNLYIMGNLEAGSWATNVGVQMTKKGSVYTASNVTFTLSGSSYSYFSLVTKLASTASDWDTVNASVRYGSTSSDLLIAQGDTQTVKQFSDNPGSATSWKILSGTYDIEVDLSAMTITIYPAGALLIPNELYILGNLDSNSWDPSAGIYMAKNGKVFTASYVTFKAVDGNEKAYFNLASVLGSSSTDWDTVNASDRYGAASNNAELVKDTPTTFVRNTGSAASSTYSWAVNPGTYDVTVNFANNTITITEKDLTGAVDLQAENSYTLEPRYYTIDGRLVSQPQSGHLYILRRGTEYKKVLYR